MKKALTGFLLAAALFAVPAGAQTIIPDRLVIPNEAGTGTTDTTLTKLTGAPSTAIITATTDTSGAIGITIANGGTTGSAIIQTHGVVTCAFDNAATAGDYVQISSSAA